MCAVLALFDYGVRAARVNADHLPDTAVRRLARVSVNVYNAAMYTSRAVRGRYWPRRIRLPAKPLR